MNTYVDLIHKAQDRIIFDHTGYHLHHIIPRSMGGTNALDNLVWLTHKEHMLAHTLLAHHWPNQWFSVELLGLRTLHKLSKWKRKRIAHHRAFLQRVSRQNSGMTERNS